MLFRAQPDHRLSRASTLCGPHVRRIRECPIVGIMPVLRSLCQGRIQTSPTKPYRPAVHAVAAPVHTECSRIQNGPQHSCTGTHQACTARTLYMQSGSGGRSFLQPVRGKRNNKKAPQNGAFFICFARWRYLKSSRSCTLALSVRSSTSTPLGGVNWKVLLPSMTSGMNLVKFTSLWLP